MLHLSLIDILAKAIIIEGLTYIEPEMLRKAFDEIRDDTKIDLRGRLDEGESPPWC